MSLLRRKRSDAEQNRAVLVSVAQFDPGVVLRHRSGAKKDTKRLHKVLSRLGFLVNICMDPTSEEIYTLFEKESRRAVKDCLLVVFSSHGEEGCIFGADGEPVQLSTIFSYFNNPYMDSKTKVFFIQACRGQEVDQGVEVDSAGSDFPEDTISQYLSVPMDTAVMYATAPGYGAFMHPLGAVFLKTLCVLLEEDGGRDLELTRLLTCLSHRVAFTFQSSGSAFRGMRQMPCFLTRMTREVYPFVEPGTEPLSATELVGGGETRVRTQSIS